MIYESFAQVYDTLMDDTLYTRWRDYTQARVPAGANLLELAGGSGSLALLLAQAGYAVTDLDLSADMLALAEQKLAAANVDVPLLQGDMRDLSGLGPYDAVTCFDDSICYMPDLKAVTQVFTQVAGVLPTDGEFLFDAHSLHQVDDLFPGYMYNYQTDDYAFLWTSYAGDLPHTVEHDLTFFVYDEKLDAYHPLSETHYERTYPVADYERALAQAGFDLVSVSADFGASDDLTHATRWFFHAKKR